ncbi:VOC family protein [Nocardia wallacei]|uniref:VOC family protein n=1 Tax=Nocardia wallacei TaxID=480035 RepID=UPI002455647B|nr:VOC family protein [Nocardia wallacei]
MLRGMAHVAFYADDLDAAERWYSEVFGMTAYYHVPGYVEFRVGDYSQEFGLIDGRFRPPGEPTEPGGEILHWHVDDLPAAFDRLLALGAKEFQAPREHGQGFVTASVVDPFGNILGVMFNQHYLDMYAEIRGA